MNVIRDSSAGGSTVCVAEFYCGIGGFAAAAARNPAVRIVRSIDIDRRALAVYQANYSSRCIAGTIESLPFEQIAAWNADFWWLSPPCQPYTRQGAQRDVDDPRAASLTHLRRAFELVRPAYLALENVPGFVDSQMRLRWLNTLRTLGYSFAECEWCPASAGIPMRRNRYYLMATCKHTLADVPLPIQPKRTLATYLEPDWSARELPEDVILHARHHELSVLDPTSVAAEARCFTSAYGRSPHRSGSYLRQPSGRVTHFHPREIARLLGFPESFVLPADLSTRQAWHLLGNSLAVPVISHILDLLLPAASPA